MAVLSAVHLFCAVLLSSNCLVESNPDAKRLYDDLLSHYNRLIRPVSNNSQVVTVRLGLHLTQLIDLVSGECFTSSRKCARPTALSLTQAFKRVKPGVLLESAAGKRSDTAHCTRSEGSGETRAGRGRVRHDSRSDKRSFGRRDCSVHGALEARLPFTHKGSSSVGRGSVSFDCNHRLHTAAE